jgi:hypothetical protein
MRRRTLLAALAGLAVVVAAGAWLLWPRQDRITPENLDRIELGMTRAEVEAILGGPPGDYRTVWTDWEMNLMKERRIEQGFIENLIWRIKQLWQHWIPATS